MVLRWGRTGQTLHLDHENRLLSNHTLHFVAGKCTSLVIIIYYSLLLLLLLILVANRVLWSSQYLDDEDGLRFQFLHFKASVFLCSLLISVHSENRVKKGKLSLSIPRTETSYSHTKATEKTHFPFSTCLFPTDGTHSPGEEDDGCLLKASFQRLLRGRGGEEVEKRKMRLPLDLFKGQSIKAQGRDDFHRQQSSLSTHRFQSSRTGRIWDSLCKSISRIMPA